MIKSVTEIMLPSDEVLSIKKQRIEPLEKTGKLPRICIVTGIHGDELEGQYVCYRLINEIRNNIEKLQCIVDVYPAVNPMGIDCITRGIPLFDLDMNRIFPGSRHGTVAEYIAKQVVEDIEGADLCIDIHASNIYLRESPQARINIITAEKLVPLAKYLNIDFIWVHPSATVLESTLAHTMNSRGVPTIVVEMGVGMRVTKTYGEELTKGILSLMNHMGWWKEPAEDIRRPLVSWNEEVEFMNAAASGFFVPAVEHGIYVTKGQHIGDIVNPLSGDIEERIEACCSGYLVTIREYPMVYQGSLVGRIIGGGLVENTMSCLRSAYEAFLKGGHHE